MKSRSKKVESLGEFAVKVAREKAGLVLFAVAWTAPAARRRSVRLLIYQRGRIIAASWLWPMINRRDHSFQFSISPEQVIESRFEIGPVAASAHDQAEISPTSNHRHQFWLRDFISPDLLGSYVGQLGGKRNKAGTAKARSQLRLPRPRAK